MRTRVGRLHTATLPGVGRDNQDRVFRTDNAVAVLDGASSVHGQRYDGGWYADRLGRQLVSGLETNPEANLVSLLAEAISSVARTPGLHENAPSSTVALARWDEAHLDVLVLGDSPAIVFHANGAATTVCDDRIDQVAVPQRAEYTRRLTAGSGYDGEHRGLLARLQVVERAARNTRNGFWIASTDPNAARHAITRRWPISEISAVLLASDGVSIAVQGYQHPPTWHQARKIIEDHGADELLRLIHAIEETDPNGQRWPRSKAHDDKAVALVDLQSPSP
jgi:serine/threonine protein phosphatase PrpC